jgi:predicted ester cyclase
MDTKSKMTPEAVVLAFLDAFNKNDLDGGMACLADDFVRLGESTKWEPMSKEIYRDMWARFADAFPDFKWETSCMVTSGDTVAIRGPGRAKRCGQPARLTDRGLAYSSASIRTGLYRTVRKKGPGSQASHGAACRRASARPFLAPVQRHADRTPGNGG